MRADYLVVGAGLTGATFARLMTDAGKKCIVIEAKDQVGGNCATEIIDGVVVHKYGPHAFRTDSERVWDFVRRFAEFSSYQHKVLVHRNGVKYSFPINLMTFQQVWGCQTPAEARQKLAEVRVRFDRAPENARDWLLSQIGEELYCLFYQGYTRKQWGRAAKDLPASIVKRIPIRFTWDDRYHESRWQGIPLGGYSPMIARMLDGIEVRTGEDYGTVRSQPVNAIADRTLYTGPLDRLFGYCCGRLEYRSLRFASHRFSGDDMQGCAQINYPGDEEYTRVIEHKHFEPSRKATGSIFTIEYPAPYAETGEPFYPVGDDENNRRHHEYEALARRAGIMVGGRLGSYKYLDMDAAIGSAMAMARRELNGAV